MSGEFGLPARNAMNDTPDPLSNTTQSPWSEAGDVRLDQPRVNLSATPLPA